MWSCCRCFRMSRRDAWARGSIRFRRSFHSRCSSKSTNSARCSFRLFQKNLSRIAECIICFILLFPGLPLQSQQRPTLGSSNTSINNDRCGANNNSSQAAESGRLHRCQTTLVHSRRSGWLHQICRCSAATR